MLYRMITKLCQFQNHKMNFLPFIRWVIFISFCVLSFFFSLHGLVFWKTETLNQSILSNNLFETTIVKQNTVYLFMVSFKSLCCYNNVSEIVVKLLSCYAFTMFWSIWVKCIKNFTHSKNKHQCITLNKNGVSN